MAKRQLVTLDLDKEFIWTPTDEIDEEKPTKFYYKALSNREYEKINAHIIKAEDGVIFSEEGVVNYDTVKLKLVKIEDIEIDGSLKNFDKKDITDKILDSLPREWIADLATQIRVTSILKGKEIEELKKS
jgi:hypothetical protein